MSYKALGKYRCLILTGLLASNLENLNKRSLDRHQQIICEQPITLSILKSFHIESNICNNFHHTWDLDGEGLMINNKIIPLQRMHIGTIN